MQPTYERMLNGYTKWMEVHRGFNIRISFHGHHEPTQSWPYKEHGTWCYYVSIDERMFSRETFEKLLVFEDSVYFGPNTLDYYQFDFMDFHGGPTYGKIETVWDRHHKRNVSIIEVGCDYNYLWDMEADYPYTYETVLADAKHSVDLFINRHLPEKVKCSWSGRWFDESEVYESKNGIVAKEFLTDIKKHDYPNWLPIEDSIND